MNTKRLEDIREIRAGCLLSAVAALCLPFLLLGAVFADLGAGMSLEQARANATNRQVEATIVSSQVRESLTDGKTRHTPQIEFRYEFDGASVRSDRVRPAPTPMSRTDAEAIIGRFPAGAIVRAWLPEPPGSLAFLEKGWSIGGYASLQTGLLAWGFCGGLLTVSGGWRWVSRSRLAGGLLSLALLGLDAAAVTHAMIHLPADSARLWLIPLGLFVAAVATLPTLGAWQAARIARRLAELPPETPSEGARPDDA